MSKKIKVYQLSNRGEVVSDYPTIADAAKAVGVNESSVRKALDKETRTVADHKWVTVYNEKKFKSMSKAARILILDIETAPIQAYVWSLWKQNIGQSQLISDWFMLTWAAKWLGEQEVYSAKLTASQALEQNDFAIVEQLWKFLDEADVVIAHHGDIFDLPKIRSRFLVHGMMPPSPYKQIDTKKIAAKEFGFSSNRMDALAKLLGHDGKSGTTMELWTRCMRGNTGALQEMEDYNVQDIYVLENVYLSLRPYIKGHPNLDLYIDSDTPSCPSCGEQALVKQKDKYFYTQAVKYELFRCSECTALCRSKKGIKYENPKQVSAIPR